jgi:integrase/recombinase XerD
MQRLCGAPDMSDPAGIRDRAMIELLYGGGLRVSELVSLRMEDYVESESLLRVLGKREKIRTLPLPAVTHDILRLYFAKARPSIVKAPCGTSVFLNSRGKPISRSGVFRILRKYAALAGIEKVIGPHTLRHTYAVHLVKNGADLRSVQELLGHASIMTTEVYTHLDMETVRGKYVSAHPRAKK